MKKNILNLFGLGKTKFSASTASLVAVIIYWSVGEFTTEKSIINACLFSGVLIWSAFSLLKNKVFASRDAKEIVVDEFLGMYICLMIANTSIIYWMAALFVAFRVLDNFKFPPFSTIDQRMKNGFGVMADDIAIGLFLGVLFPLLIKFIP